MREIKFRFWNSILKKIIYDPLLIDLVDYGQAIKDNGDVNVNLLLSEYPKLMQYTGQKDRNGKEIWEGDILHSNIDIIYEVFWSDRYSGFYLKEIKRPECFGTYPLEEISRLSFKKVDSNTIIGNIYANPELRIIKDENN